MANLNDKLVDYKSLKENTKLTLGEALAYDKGLAGGYNGDFPLTVATKGNIYRVPATNKFYMCITDYNGSNLTAPNANFKELSVWANRDKLENLTKKEFYKITNDFVMTAFNINNILIAFGYKVITETNIDNGIPFPIHLKKATVLATESALTSLKTHVQAYTDIEKQVFYVRSSVMSKACNFLLIGVLG